MTITVTNAQSTHRVDVAGLTRLAQRAVIRLKIRTPGQLPITMLDARRMRAINKRFLRHDRITDVITFRYDNGRAEATLPTAARIVGELLIAPAAAHRYAKAHGLAYREELARYVVHGLLHWTGADDRTAKEQAAMRRAEDRLMHP